MASSFRTNVEKLQEYELPNQYKCNVEDSNGLDESLTKRYHEARNEYIQRRCQQVFYQHLETWNGTTFESPDVLSDQDLQQQQVVHDEATQQLLNTTSDMNRQMQVLESKYTSFVSSREELAHLVDEMQKKSQDDDDDNDDMSDKDVDEEEMVLEEQRLANLIQRKKELEAQLRSIRNETAEAKLSTEHYQLSVHELQLARGNERVESPTSTADVHLASVEELAAKKADMEHKVAELRDMRDWYDEMHESVEEISGIKIKSVEAESKDNNLVLTLQLRDKHEVQIVMASPESKNQNQDELRVVSAKFLSDTLVSAPSVHNQDDDRTAVVQMRIPNLDDLVKLGATMGPGEDLKFLLRETQARIDTTYARVEEISLLRTRYLTNIKKTFHLDYGFGGKHQEVVCSLNLGLTIILHLGPDCPMVPGSAHVQQIVGSGGWDQGLLKQLQDTVNAKLCHGPLALMDALLAEIKRLEEQENLSIPRTPKLPQRSKA